MTTPQTATLTSWLLSCIAEDEAAARVFVNELGVAERWGCDEVGAKVRDLREAIPFGLDDLVTTGRTHMDAAHIARHDPAHVLAVSAAHRRIVELHRDGRSGDYIEPWCATCSDDEDLVYLPCPTLRALASAYADHEDWREEWR